MISRRGFTLSVIGALATRLPASEADLSELSLAEVSARIRSRAVTPTQLTEACLARIETYNPKLNAFITVMREQALARPGNWTRNSGRRAARSAARDSHRAQGQHRHGGRPDHGGSAVFDDRVPDEDAEVARRLKAAGAVIIGKANLHEFAMGGTSATSYYGPVRNPWALDRNPGGSSGGSAAAVAADLVLRALGTDTGGSIRTPASFCGVVGLKPTYGLVSIRGIIPLTLSLDHCGPIDPDRRRCRGDAQRAGGIRQARYRQHGHSQEDYVAAMRQPVSGLRLGLPRAPFFDLLDADVAKAVEDAIGVLAKLTKGVPRIVSCPPRARSHLGARGLRLSRGVLYARPGPLHDRHADGP